MYVEDDTCAVQTRGWAQHMETRAVQWKVFVLMYVQTENWSKDTAPGSRQRLMFVTVFT